MNDLPADDNPLVVTTPNTHQSQPLVDDVLIRPIGVTVTGVLCSLAGGLGVLMAVLIVLQLLFASQINNAFTPPGKAGQAQRQFQAELQAVTDKYMPGHLTVGVVNMGISICLLVGGIACLRSCDWAPLWLRRVFLALIVFELIRTIFYIVVQIDMAPALEQGLERMAKADPNAPAAAMQSIQKISTIIGYVFWAVWIIGKLIVIIWGRVYMGKEHVVDYFRRANSVTPAT